MSDTNNGTAKKTTALCNVTFGSNWVEVQSETGATLRLDIAEKERSWLSTEDKSLLNALTVDAPQDDSEVELTYAQMKAFKAITEKISTRREKEKNALPDKVVIKSVQQVFANPTDAGNGKFPQIGSVKAIAPVKTTTANDFTSKTAAKIENDVANRTVVTTSKSADLAEARIAGLQAVVAKVKDETYFQVEYDIPSVKNGDCPNPSGRIFLSDETKKGWYFAGLWRYGFRRTKSCWVLPRRSLESPAVARLLAHLESHGCEVEVIEYAASQNDKVRARAEQKLTEEIRRIHTSLIETIANADADLQACIADEEKTAKDEEAAGLKRDATVRTRIRLAGEALDASIACAEMFDLNEKVADLLNGLRHAIRSQAITFNAHARQVGIKSAPMPK